MTKRNLSEREKAERAAKLKAERDRRNAALAGAFNDPHGPELIQAGPLKIIFGGVSEMWVWRRVEDGTLPAPIIIGRRRFWHRPEIKNLIEGRLAQRRDPTSDTEAA